MLDCSCNQVDKLSLQTADVSYVPPQSVARFDNLNLSFEIAFVMDVHCNYSLQGAYEAEAVEFGSCQFDHRAGILSSLS